MPNVQRKSIGFPIGGLDRRTAYYDQPPYSTPDCKNVRPIGPIEGRERGGSRPGLVLSHITDLSDEIRLIYPMVLNLGDNFTVFSDGFSGLSMEESWSLPSWASDMPSILSSVASASIDTSVETGDAVLDALTIDTSENYCVEMLIVPWNGSFHGNYKLYLRLDDTTPDITEDGVIITLTMDNEDGTYSGSLITYDGGDETQYNLSAGESGTSEPGWLTALVNSDTIAVYWRGTQLLSHSVDSHSGTRVGFGLECTNEDGVALCNVFRVQYYSTGSVDAARTLLIVSAGGSLYKETFYGMLEEISTDLSLRDDVPIQAIQSGQKLYIADYGDLRTNGTDGSASGTSLDATGIDDWTALGISTYDDVVVISNGTGTVVDGTYQISSIAEGNLTLASDAGTGDCSYRIQRAPKIYDPSDDSLSIFEADTGQVPTGCPLICRFCDRIVFAGQDVASHVWYMARQGDEDDWDYSQEDDQRAVAGTSSEAGVPGTTIIALIPHSDDYLIFGCRNEMWLLRGDPAYGGSLDALSRVVGVMDAQSWCLGPSGELVFLSMDGLYSVAAGGDESPVQLSREKLPQEFKNINPESVTILMEYDTEDRGIHLYVTPDSPNDRTHWWVDWDRKSFWPLVLDGDYEPTALRNVQSSAVEETGVLLGCRDGFLRRYDSFANTDCGTSFDSEIIIGPFLLGQDGNQGAIVSLSSILGEDSGDVDWEVRTDLTPELSITATAISSGTWEAGLNATTYPTGYGAALSMKLTGNDRPWVLEQIIIGARDLGILRIK